MTTDPIREALRRIPYGIYCVTSRNGDEVNAMVATWMTQVSFKPRLLAIGVQKTSHSYKLIEQGKVFAVNIFRKEDIEAIKKFTKGLSKNPDKMEDVNYTDGPETGCPILADSAAYLECRVRSIYDEGGDHNIVVGEIVSAGINKPGDMPDTLSLIDLGWSYAG